MLRFDILRCVSTGRRFSAKGTSSSTFLRHERSGRFTDQLFREPCSRGAEISNSTVLEAWITPDEMYALAVIASLMLLGKSASEHESTEYDFLLGDDDMMGSMDRSENWDTNQKQYHPHPHSPEPLSSMLRRSTRDLLHVTSMRVYNISTLKSGARGRWG